MASCHTHAALLPILPRKPQNAQKFLAEKSIPQMHTDEHRLGVPAGGVGGVSKLPYSKKITKP